MKDVVITEWLAAPGVRVVRGPYWEWGDQDGGVGGIGTIIEEPKAGWVGVKWEHGSSFSYRVGGDGCYDLKMYVPTFVDTAKNLMQPDQRVKQARQALADSIKVAEKQSIYQTEKSTKHGHTNSGSNSNRPNPIKVRRPISTVEGSKRRSRAPIKRGRGSTGS